MSLTDLEVRKHTEPLKKELNKQKEKNALLKKKAFKILDGMLEEMREACAREAHAALLEAGEDPRAADSMLRRIRGVPTKRNPLKDAMKKSHALIQESSAFLRAFRVLSPVETLTKKQALELLDKIDSAMNILRDALEDP